MAGVVGAFSQWPFATESPHRMSIRQVFSLLLMVGLVSSRDPLSAADGAGQRYVIIHADDAGMSHSVNLGTIEAMEKGCVSSASIMVPCPWFPEIAAYAKEHPEKDFGIHLTLNSEWKVYRWGPVAPREKVASLLDKDGYLPHEVPAVAASAIASEVELELRAQITRARQFGVPVTHLDTHMGALVSRPDLVEVYVRMGIEFNLPVLFIRNAQNDEKLAKENPALAAKAVELGQLLDEHRLPVLDSLSQFYGGTTQEMRKQSYLRALRELKPGVSEIIIHCGIDNAELQGITNSSANRDGDRQIFTSSDVIDEIRQLGIKVISWKQFHEMIVKNPVPVSK
jgi:predicted glycoside hydrolase/deacetylase ChbG (UPF0249 family)